MAPSFVHCPECDRHVRVADRVCPFCAAVMPELEGEPQRAGAAPRGLTRAAILFAGATAVAGCASATGPDVVAAYGPAPVDSGMVDSEPGPDIVAMYGPAPIDAGGTDSRDAATPPDQVVAAYGPAPVDP